MDTVTIEAGRHRLAGYLQTPLAEPRQLAVLCHGLGSSAEALVEFAKALAERGAAVLSLDYSGHGRSPGPRGLVTERSHQAETQAAAQWLRATWKGPPLLLVGHSFGAHAALRTSAQLRGIIHGVAVISAPLRSAEAQRPHRRVLVRLAGHALRALGPLAPSLALRMPEDPERPGPRVIDVRTLAYAARMDNVMAAGRLSATQTGLVVRGLRDPQVSDESARALYGAMRCRRKRLLELPASGHSPFSGSDLAELACAIAELTA